VRRAAATGLIALALGGCGGGSHKSAPPSPPPPPDREVIRGWLAALNAGDYVAAGSYFARNALVQQSETFRLKTQADAEEFNRELPCRADLGPVKDEGRTSIAVFNLRSGPGGPCRGSTRVRFTISKGHFREWRQLPDRVPGRVA
jgi:hypothetical protein